MMRIERGRRLGMLDGLRGLALIAVIAYHVAPSTIRGGFLGVEVFFVLSGYLLASLLLGEMAKTGGIKRGAYALRRIWRIGPALVGVLLGLILVAPRIAPDDVHRLGGDIISSLAGFTNWHLIQDGNSYFARSGRPPLVRHMWSIAVEVQFYLLCPFLVGWLARRRSRNAIALLGFGIGASAALMAILYQSPDPSRAYYGTDTRVGALLAGVLLAFLLERRATENTRRQAAWPVHLGLWALAVLLYLVGVADDRARWLYPTGFLATQATTSLVIVGGLRPGYLGTILKDKRLTWLGKRSYGIYLWHWPAVALLRPGIDVGWPSFVTGAISIGFALVMGALSYRYVERPFMRPKPAHLLRPLLWRRMLRPAGVAAVLVPLVALSLQLPTVDPVAASLRAGERVISRQSAPSQELPPFVLSASTPPPPGPILPPPPAQPPPPPPTPPGPLRVTAIGDSVMVGAAGALQAKLGPTGYIDAHLGRQFKEQLAVVRSLGQQGRLGHALIAHFGNNGPVKGKQVDELMAELSAVPHVVLVTVRVHKPWQDSVNRTYAEAAARYPAIKLADWFGRSAGHLEWFQSDGTHLKPKGAEAYASLIAESLPPAPALQPTPSPPAHAGWPLQPPTAVPAPAPVLVPAPVLGPAPILGPAPALGPAAAIPRQ
jgi:peptidoglycan/LPS O-acetylase OafA/YrhL